MDLTARSEPPGTITTAAIDGMQSSYGRVVEYPGLATDMTPAGPGPFNHIVRFKPGATLSIRNDAPDCADGHASELHFMGGSAVARSALLLPEPGPGSVRLGSAWTNLAAAGHDGSAPHTGAGVSPGTVAGGSAHPQLSVPPPEPACGLDHNTPPGYAPHAGVTAATQPGPAAIPETRPETRPETHPETHPEPGPQPNLDANIAAAGATATAAGPAPQANAVLQAIDDHVNAAVSFAPTSLELDHWQASDPALAGLPDRNLRDLTINSVDFAVAAGHEQTLTLAYATEPGLDLADGACIVIQKKIADGRWGACAKDATILNPGLLVAGQFGQVKALDLASPDLEPGAYRVHATFGSLPGATEVVTDVNVSLTDAHKVNAATCDTGHILANGDVLPPAVTLQAQKVDAFIDAMPDGVVVDGKHCALLVQGDGADHDQPSSSLLHSGAGHTDTFQHRILSPGHASTASIAIHINGGVLPDAAGAANL